jgi:bifunctional non-homologous end joining protein LigD
MGLSTYKKKRRFDETPEPKGKLEKSKTKLSFVIQRHDASRLHYDFRLEADGVLKSWAVPKGPSLNPADKRLAVMVEDHPVSYGSFEGDIPEGNYGAGHVDIWDHGSYEPVDEQGNVISEKDFLKHLEEGSIKFAMKGRKLKGEFALVKLKNSEGNNWLLIKHRDKYATDEDYDSEQYAKKSSLKYSAEKRAKKAAAKKSSLKKTAAKKATVKPSVKNAVAKKTAVKKK